jgi:hypothetical protein
MKGGDLDIMMKSMMPSENMSTAVPEYLLPYKISGAM